MRFLKKKIYLSQQLRQTQQGSGTSPCFTDLSKTDSNPDSPVFKVIEECYSGEETGTGKRTKSSCKTPKTPEKIRCTKNIVKNYGRTIASFACSDLALPYLKPMLAHSGVEYLDAIAFFTKAKMKIQGIDTFRAQVLVLPQDSTREAALKVLFQKIGEVFIKCFSVNWIFHSKIQHKQAYLQYRFKMLRRLKNPELFTYLKG